MSLLPLSSHRRTSPFARTVFLRSRAWRSEAPLVIRLVAVFGFGME